MLQYFGHLDDVSEEIARLVLAVAHFLLRRPAKRAQDCHERASVAINAQSITSEGGSNAGRWNRTTPKEGRRKHLNGLIT